MVSTVHVDERHPPSSHAVNHAAVLRIRDVVVEDAVAARKHFVRGCVLEVLVKGPEADEFPCAVDALCLTHARHEPLREGLVPRVCVPPQLAFFEADHPLAGRAIGHWSPCRGRSSSSRNPCCGRSSSNRHLQLLVISFFGNVKKRARTSGLPVDVACLQQHGFSSLCTII